jgi:hypothetical protein
MLTTDVLSFNFTWTVPANVSQSADLDAQAAFSGAGASSSVGSLSSGPSYGGIYSGDSLGSGTKSESVRWPAGTSPPRTTYYLCVSWYPGTIVGGGVNVSVTVLRAGVAVPLRVSRLIDTSLQPDSTCGPASNTLVGSFVYV